MCRTAAADAHRIAGAAESSQAVKRTAQRAFTAINHSLTAPTERFVEYDSKLQASRQMFMFPNFGWLWTQAESTRLS
jgi:hypothetical protein